MCDTQSRTSLQGRYTCPSTSTTSSEKSMSSCSTLRTDCAVSSRDTTTVLRSWRAASDASLIMHSGALIATSTPEATLRSDSGSAAKAVNSTMSQPLPDSTERCTSDRPSKSCAVVSAAPKMPRDLWAVLFRTRTVLRNCDPCTQHSQAGVSPDSLQCYTLKRDTLHIVALQRTLQQNMLQPQQGYKQHSTQHNIMLTDTMWEAWLACMQMQCICNATRYVTATPAVETHQREQPLVAARCQLWPRRMPACCRAHLAVGAQKARQRICRR